MVLFSIPSWLAFGSERLRQAPRADENLSAIRWQYRSSGLLPSIHRELGGRAFASQVRVLEVNDCRTGELRYGIARRPGVTQLQTIVEEFLIRVAILPWDSDAARQYENLRARLESAGQPMGNLDLMVGAHALSLGAILVTNDRAFTRIKKLKVEDWTA